MVEARLPCEHGRYERHKLKTSQPLYISGNGWCDPWSDSGNTIELRRLEAIDIEECAIRAVIDSDLMGDKAAWVSGWETADE